MTTPLTPTIHRHASHGDCRTVCGLACDTVAVAYAYNVETVTCTTCTPKVAR